MHDALAGRLPGIVVWRPYRQDTIGTFASSDSALSKKYETLRIPYGAGRNLTADNFPSFPSCTTARIEPKQLQIQLHPIVERSRNDTSGVKAHRLSWGSGDVISPGRISP